MIYAVAAGLSPRVRGNQIATKSTGELTGSIPACAGEPVGSPASKAHYRVYPRVCGGTDHLRLEVLLGQGLSPRVRGNPALNVVCRFMLGSIPACAGEPA